MKTALNCRQKTLGEPVYKFDIVKSPTSPTGFVWWCRCTLFHPHHRTTEGVAIDKSDVLVRGSAHWLEEGRGRRQVQAKTPWTRDPATPAKKEEETRRSLTTDSSPSLLRPAAGPKEGTTTTPSRTPVRRSPRMRTRTPLYK